MPDEIKNAGWEHFDHQADIGIRGFGATKSQAFAQAALAMTAVITEPAKVRADEEIIITCQAADDELLLVDWLNSLLYEMATRKMLFSKFDVNIEKNRLNATVLGQKIILSLHRPAVEVKAASYAELKVYKNENKIWIAQCVVDV